MSDLERNKKNALAFISAIGSQDDMKLGSLYARDGRFWQVGKKLVLSGSHSLAEIAQHIPKIYARLPDGMEFDILNVMAEGNSVAVEAESRATLADGSPYENQYHFLFHFDDDGKVVEFKEYWDTLYAYETLFDGDANL